MTPMEGMPELQVGDTITVHGYIKNYNGTIEFASKYNEEESTQVYVYIVDHDPTPSNGSIYAPLTVGQTLTAVADLEAGTYTSVPYYTKGVVTEIGQNVTQTYFKNVYFTDGENTMRIYSLNPMQDMPYQDGYPLLKVGDTITVFGYIKNYLGELEYANKNMEDGSVVYVWIVSHEEA
jgi:DNA/RNA endonuclease YhcR with UshA esterase domain